MRRTLVQLLLTGLILAQPVPAAQQNETPPKPQDSQPQQAEPEPQGSARRDLDVGTYYMHKGDVDAAISRFEEAVRLQPNLVKARMLLAEAYEKKGDKAAAVKCYREYLQAFPKAPDVKKIQRKIEKLSSQ